ncbi:MAG: MFS transporter [Elusimicrobia bacterium]|nr:MFS transporter [Elusimicrobiota bacterium]
MIKGSVRRSLDASVKDGVAWSVMSGFVDGYTVPFAMALQAGSMEIGILRSLGPLLSSLGQLKTADLVNSLRSRKKFLSMTVQAQVVSLALAAACVFLPRAAALPLLIAAGVIYTVSGTLAGPPWASMMGEYLPSSTRGIYFGWRNRIVGITVTVFAAVAGGILAWFGTGVLTGFLVLFGSATALRVVSWRYVMRMYEPPYREAVSEHFTFTQFVSQLGHSNFAAFTFCCAFYTFAVSISGPFFAVYLLDALHYDYLRYMAVTTASPLTMYLTMRYWGGWADAIGGARVVKMSMVMIPIIPLLWALSPDYRFLACVELYSGFAWAAYLMGVNNFIYDAVTQAKRTRAMAYFSAVTGLGQAVAPLIGGYLYPRMPAVGGHSFVCLLLITASLRVVAGIAFIRYVKEVKPSEAVQPKDALQRIIGQRFFGLGA